MIGVFVPRLARSYGRDPSVAFVLAVSEPSRAAAPDSGRAQ